MLRFALILGTFALAVGQYEPEWESLATRPLPRWYDEAKVGIFVHWGLYSVPDHGSEWFWYNWKSEEIPSYESYMTQNFKPGFTYQEFAPLFTGENFDPQKWASLFEDAGAKYVVFTSKHHDGFALWPSSYSSSWNSVDVGPKRDVVKDLSEAVRARNLTFGLYYSLGEWYSRLYAKDLSSRPQRRDYVDGKVMQELRELIDRYAPEVIWSDGDWFAMETYWKSREFLAWLYNESPVRETVVTNDRWDVFSWCSVGDFRNCQDNYNPKVLQPFKFENAFPIDRESWGWRSEADLDDYLTSQEIIEQIVETVSCNGNVLVNVAPDRTGSIPAVYQERLRDMGKWLRTNGEGIYGTSPWTRQSENERIWFTWRPNFVYVFLFDYQPVVELSSVSQFVTRASSIRLLGHSKPLEFTRTDDAVRVSLPEKHELDREGLGFVWTLRICKVCP